jgi:hypothetical protein
MVKDEQVRKLRKKRMQGKTLAFAAMAAGMSERTARKWQRGDVPSAMKTPRAWRTRLDPFAEVWAAEIEPLLINDTEGKLEAKTIFEELTRRRPGAYAAGQVRTLQRRIRGWRAQHGAEKEVMFPQDHAPGRMASIDFTHGTELGVTIAGVLFVHLLFEFVLAYSGFRFVQLAFGETFEALLSGLQGGLFAAGGVPQVVRLDNLSAATHELAQGGRTLTSRFSAVVDHYGFRSSRIQAGEGHENGVAEKAHDLLKKAIRQALLLRESNDFATVDAYVAFVEHLVEQKFHAGREDKIAAERAVLGPLPAMKLPEYTRVSDVVVRTWSTINISGRIYSVPSRLIGRRVEARVHPNVVEVLLPGVEKPILTMPRLRGAATHAIDYRHVIWSLVKKPGAFAAYRFREDLYPSLVFRRAYDALRARRGDRADVDYVRILHLAASTTEHGVEAALTTLLERGGAFDYATVKAIALPERPEIPELHIGVPDLSGYDALLAAGGEA